MSATGSAWDWTLPELWTRLLGWAEPRCGSLGSGMERPIEEPPPLMGTWRRLYAAVVAYLFLLITLFYLFTRHYSRP